MKLTERRKEFLNQIIALYKKTGLPVHYVTLAEIIGVSKWTAYDMFKELEKNGLLKRGYEVNSKEPGRSVIVFTPTRRAQELFAQTRKRVNNQDELRVHKEKVAKFVHGLRSADLKDTVGRIIQILSRVETRVEFCLYILALFLVYLDSIGQARKEMIRHLLKVSIRPEIELTMFVGTVIGIVIHTVGDEMGPQMTELVGLFVQYLEELSFDELQMLTAFLTERLR